MTSNYIKAVGQRPNNVYDLRASTGWVTEGSGSGQALHPGAPPVLLEEYFFFDDADPVSISSAQQKSQAYKDRNPGCRIVFSVWRAIPSLRYLEIGAPRPEPKWRAAS